MKKNIDKKIIDNGVILNLNILSSYTMDFENDEKKNIKNIFDELFLIKEFFNKVNLIEILKLFLYKNDNDFKTITIIFLNIFKYLSEEYINNYEYILIIFELLKLYKNKYFIFDIIKYKNINLSNFYISLKSYFIILSTKSELIKLLLLIKNINIDIKDLNLLFNMLSKDFSNYLTFENIYDKLLDCVFINDFNLNLIIKNKKNLKNYYNTIYKNLNDLYDFNDLNKYKVNSIIISYFNKLLKSIEKIKIIS
jgi:hypothetical protein